jgi:hypothetical protein
MLVVAFLERSLIGRIEKTKPVARAGGEKCRNVSISGGGKNEARVGGSVEKCRMVGCLILGRSLVGPLEKTKPGVFGMRRKVSNSILSLPFVSRLRRHSEAINERGASTVFRLFGN